MTDPGERYRAVYNPKTGMIEWAHPAHSQRPPADERVSRRGRAPSNAPPAPPPATAPPRPRPPGGRSANVEERPQRRLRERLRAAWAALRA